MFLFTLSRWLHILIHRANKTTRFGFFFFFKKNFVTPSIHTHLCLYPSGPSIQLHWKRFYSSCFKTNFPPCAQCYPPMSFFLYPCCIDYPFKFLYLQSLPLYWVLPKGIFKCSCICTLKKKNHLTWPWILCIKNLMRPVLNLFPEFHLLCIPLTLKSSFLLHHQIKITTILHQNHHLPTSH